MVDEEERCCAVGRLGDGEASQCLCMSCCGRGEVPLEGICGYICPCSMRERVDYHQNRWVQVNEMREWSQWPADGAKREVWKCWGLHGNIWRNDIVMKDSV